jgi:hypothetical protein
MSRHGIYMPEPWREEQLCYGYGRRPSGDLYANQGGTEFGWGAGLVAPCNNGLPPGPGDDPGLAAGRVGGGQYMPKAPRVIPPCGGVGQPWQYRRPNGEVRGYPGEQVAR